jgi:hypothetical protein
LPVLPPRPWSLRRQRQAEQSARVFPPDPPMETLVGIQGLNSPTFSLTNFYQAPVGEVGHAGPWGTLIIGRIDRLVYGNCELVNGVSAFIHAYVGSWNGLVNYTAQAPSGGLVGASSQFFTMHDQGRLFVVVSIAGPPYIRLFADREEQPRDALTAFAGTKAGAGPMVIGKFANATIGFLSMLGFLGSPSVGQIQNLFDYVRRFGDVPRELSWGTIRHRWSLRESTRQQIPVNGAPAPAQIEDLVTHAAQDALVKNGSLMLGVIDPTQHGREALGVCGCSAADFYAAAAGLGLTGSAGGFWIGLLFRVASNGTAPSGVLACYRHDSLNGGWTIYLSTNNTNITVHLWNAGGTSIAASYALDPRFNALPRTVALVWNGASLILYFEGTQFNISACATYMLPPAGASLRLGADRLVGATAPITWSQVYGLAGGHAVPTPAEIAAWSSATLDGMRIQPIPGKTLSLYDPPQDISDPDGGSPMPSTLVDRVGSTPLSRVGSPRLARFVRRLWNYDKDPTLYGLGSFSSSAYYAAPVNALPGASAFSISVLLRILHFRVPSATRTLFGQRSGGMPGWSLRSTGSLGVLVFGVGGASASADSASLSVGAGMLSKLLLVTGVYDGTKVSLYTRYGIVGSAVSLGQAYVADTSAAPTIGARSGGALPGDNLVIYGCTYALGVPTLGQIEAQHDQCMSRERIVLPPGMAGTLIDVNQDVRDNDNRAPATLIDRGLGTVNFSRLGAPSATPHYMRSWAS